MHRKVCALQEEAPTGSYVLMFELQMTPEDQVHVCRPVPLDG